jgi:ribosome maturation factor RimP
MLSVSDSSVIIEETKGKGKKLEISTHTIEITDIKTTKIQIKF